MPMFNNFIKQTRISVTVETGPELPFTFIFLLPTKLSNSLIEIPKHRVCVSQ